MFNPTGIPQKDQLSTYVGKDLLTDEEVKYLQIQDHLLNTAMGGVLPEQTDPERFLRILDVGCGTGNWLLDMAEAYPKAIELVGTDAGLQILESARIQAQTRQLEKRVRFRAMDALGVFDFPDDSFDLINMRFGSNFLRTWEWNRLLQEMRRISRSGGVVRITELDIVESNNPLVRSCNSLIVHAFYQSGHFFTEQNDGLTSELVPLLQKQGWENVQMRECRMSYVDGAVGKQLLEFLLGSGFQMVLPFLRKWARIPDRQGDLSQQILQEMQQPGFDAIAKIKTVWGTCPKEASRI